MTFDPNDSDPNHALTFREWHDAGYMIRKGSKSIVRSPLNESLFTPSQAYYAGFQVSPEPIPERYPGWSDKGTRTS